MRTNICVRLRKSAVKYSLKDLPKALVPNGDMFLFVAVSRQTKKAILCVSAVNHYLRKSAKICG